MHKRTQLGERARGLAVGGALGTCAAQARGGTLLVRLAKPLGTLLMEAPELLIREPGWAGQNDNGETMEQGPGSMVGR